MDARGSFTCGERGVEHKIDLKPGAEPKVSKPRRLSQAEH